MKLLKNIKVSSGKRTRNFDLKLFCIMDLLAADEVVVKHRLMDIVVIDCMSKLSVGSKFKVFRNVIMSLSIKCHNYLGQQEYTDYAHN